MKKAILLLLCCGLIMCSTCNKAEPPPTENSVSTVSQTKTPESETESSPTILLPPSTASILRRRRETAFGDWIFRNLYNPELPMAPSSAYNKLKVILKNAELPLIRFHDLRHTFATRSLENGMDVKTLSSIIGHVSAATTLDIYSHMTDTMQMQAAMNIDRKIGGTDAEMPELEQTPKLNIKTQPAPDFKPLERKIRKSGTGCVYQINDTLWEGSYYPRLPNGKRKKFNVYAKTKEECEIKLFELIAKAKKEITEEKAKRNN